MALNPIEAHQLPVDALGLLHSDPESIGGPADLASGLLDGFTRLKRDGVGELLVTGLYPLGDGLENIGPLPARQGPCCRKSPMG